MDAKRKTRRMVVVMADRWMGALAMVLEMSGDDGLVEKIVGEL